MLSSGVGLFPVPITGLAALASSTSAKDKKLSEREAMYYRYLQFPSLVKGGTVQPHWMADGSTFWYAEGAPDQNVIYKVDPRANTRTSLFDTVRLRQALAPVLGHEPPYQGLPFEDFSFLDQGEKGVRFTVEKTEFVLQLDTYDITRTPAEYSLPAHSKEEKSRRLPQSIPQPLTWPDVVMEVPSPDGRWFAGYENGNIRLRSSDDGRSIPVTTAGVDEYGWSWNRYVQSPKSVMKRVYSRIRRRDGAMLATRAIDELS